MGRYFEEFSIGDEFITSGRTISEQDIRTFADLTEDHNPVHVDREFAARSLFGGVIGHGPMMVGMVFGLLGRLDLLEGTIMALKGLEWSFNAPIRPGDTVHVCARVVEARPSRRFTDRGSVRFHLDVMNQAGAVVQVGSATGIMKKRDVEPASS